MLVTPWPTPTPSISPALSLCLGWGCPTPHRSLPWTVPSRLQGLFTLMPSFPLQLPDYSFLQSHLRPGETPLPTECVPSPCGWGVGMGETALSILCCLTSCVSKKEILSLHHGGTSLLLSTCLSVFHVALFSPLHEKSKSSRDQLTVLLSFLRRPHASTLSFQLSRDWIWRWLEGMAALIAFALSECWPLLSQE